MAAASANCGSARPSSTESTCCAWMAKAGAIGSAAPFPADFIRRYCEPSALSGAIIYGFFVDGVLRGAAELRLLEPAGDAEVALNIERTWQSQGVGTALLEHLLLAAGNRGIDPLHMLCLAE